MNSDVVFVGIDLSSSARRCTVAILSGQLELQYLASPTHDKAYEMLLAQPDFLCGIVGPSNPSRGLLADKAYRERLGITSKIDRYRTCRVSEYELLQRRLSIYKTPVDKANAPAWMQSGWEFYKKIRKKDVAEYPRAGSRRVFETYPAAGFAILIGKRPYTKSMVEGLLQRQLLLYEEGVNIPDPMGLLEEWTRFRILNGQLSRTGIYSKGELDAVMAAYTAFLLEREPSRIIAVGDPAEGQIILPGERLEERY